MAETHPRAPEPPAVLPFFSTPPATLLLALDPRLAARPKKLREPVGGVVERTIPGPGIVRSTTPPTGSRSFFGRAAKRGSSAKSSVAGGVEKKGKTAGGSGALGCVSAIVPLPGYVALQDARKSRPDFPEPGNPREPSY